MAITKDFSKKIIMTMANYLNIPPCDVTFLKMDDEHSTVMGYYVDEINIININLDIFKELTEFDFTVFLIHEMRHAYQYFQIKKVDTKDEPKEVIKIWKEELKNYKNPNSKDYLMQSIEIDAVAFTSYFSKKYLKKELIIPEIIQDKVVKRIQEIAQKYQ